MRNLFLYLLLAIILFFISCKKDNSTIYSASNEFATTTSLAGFGDRPGTPSGYPFCLPYNVRVTTPIVIIDSTVSSYPKYGVGIINGIFTLKNSNNYPATVNFPAGLIFLPDNDTSQKGMTVYPVTFTIPSNDSTRILLRFSCINKHKNYFYVNYYTMSVISNNNQVATLTNALKNKNDSILFNHRWQLQDMVYDISESTGLTQADLDSIQSW
ncbi:MAG: hypothetical protein WCQ95_02080 [Bacteroidota bacterium]